jgi:hypothetical protein
MSGVLVKQAQLSITRLFSVSHSMQAQLTPMEPTVWFGLGRLTQLRELQLGFMDFAYLPGMLHLSRLRQLTCLYIVATEPEMLDDVKVTMTTPVSGC